MDKVHYFYVPTFQQKKFFFSKKLDLKDPEN